MWSMLVSMLVSRSRFPLGGEMLPYRHFIKFVSLALVNPDGITRALTKTRAKPITEVIRRQYRFAINHRDGTFSA
jgi:hypothetical protein